MKILTIISYSLKFIAYTLCAIGCFYQVISIFNLYFSFPTTVFSFVEIMESLELPAISFCTNNRLMLNKMKDFDQSFSIEWDELDDPGRADMIQTKVVS